MTLGRQEFLAVSLILAGCGMLPLQETHRSQTSLTSARTVSKDRSPRAPAWPPTQTTLPAGTIPPPLEAVQGAYQTFNYEFTVRYLEDYLRIYPPPSREFSDCLAYAGAAAYLLGNERKAKLFFMKIHAIDSSYRIDEEMFPPTVCSMFYMTFDR